MMSSTWRDRGPRGGGPITGLIVIPLVLACAGTRLAPTSPVSPETSPTWAAPTQTDAPSPSATIDPTAAVRILARLEELHGLYAKGDGAGIGAWVRDEEAWVAGHLTELSRPAVEVTAYVASVRALRSAVDADRDLNHAIVALLTMREAMAARASEVP